MSRLILFGATGSLGGHVLRQALAAGHQVTVLVRNPSGVPLEALDQVSIHKGDISMLAPADMARLISGQDALINCAGRVREGQVFVHLVDRLVTSVEVLSPAARPVCWFLAGVAVMDIDPTGRKGVDLPVVKSMYWPHRANFERLSRSGLDWRLLCPGPMVDQPPLGLNRLRVAADRWPVQAPGFARALPGLLFLPFFLYLLPEMIGPYADAAAFMLAHLDPANPRSRRRVGLALPPGMRGRKSTWAASS